MKDTAWLSIAGDQIIGSLLTDEQRADLRADDGLYAAFAEAFEPFVDMARRDAEMIELCRRLGNRMEQAGHPKLAEMWYAEQRKTSDRAEARRLRVWNEVVKEWTK